MDEFNYIRACLGEGYTPVHLTRQEATQPLIIRDVLAEVKGSRAADVIAALVKENELARQRL